MRLTLLVGVILLALSACGSSSDEDASELANRLEAAKSVLDNATTISLDLASDNLPSDATGLLSATGKGNHDPAFTGQVKVRTGGASLTAEVIAVDGKVWAKTSFAPEFLAIKPTSLKAPNPASLFAADEGISSLLAATTQLGSDGQKRSGSHVLTAITGSLDGDVVQRLIPTADADKSFDVVYSLTDDELASARITGPFYPEATSMSYTVELSTSSKPVTISAP